MKNKIKTFIILSELTTTVIHMINRIKNSLYNIKNYLRHPNNNYYEWRFGKIRYIKKGTGSPVLLIHDLTIGSSNYEFNKIIDSLSEKHEVYAIDLLGYGLSDKPNITYTNYLFVQLVIDFIKNIIGKKTNIITTGDSVQIAVMACHNDPEAIHRMIFINPQNLYELNKIPSKQTRFLKFFIDTPIIGTFIYNLLSNKATMEKLFNEEYISHKMNVEEKDILSYLEAAHYPDYTSKYAFSSYIGKYMNTNIIHALKEINHCIYIIGGEEEKEIHTTVENYIYYNNSIEAVFIPYTKHLPHLETGAKVMEYINIFL